MNTDIVRGKWKRLRGRAKKWWGEVIGDAQIMFDGEQTELNGTAQERVGRLRQCHKRSARALQSWRL